MFTKREQKIIKNIRKGRPQQTTIALTIIMLITASFFISIIRNTLLDDLERKYKKLNSAMVNLETKTEVEEKLKNMLLDADSEYIKLIKNYIDLLFKATLIAIFYGVLLMVGILWVVNMYSKIIRKLLEKET